MPVAQEAGIWLRVTDHRVFLVSRIVGLWVGVGVWVAEEDPYPFQGLQRTGLPGCLPGSSPLWPPWGALPIRTSPATWLAPADLSRSVWGIEPEVGRGRK